MKDIIYKFHKILEDKEINYNNETWNIKFNPEFSISSNSFRISFGKNIITTIDTAIIIPSYTNITISNSDDGCYFLSGSSEHNSLTHTEVNDIIAGNTALLFQKSMLISSDMIKLMDYYIKNKKEVTEICNKLGYNQFINWDFHHRDVEIILNEIYREYIK